MENQIEMALPQDKGHDLLTTALDIPVSDENPLHCDINCLCNINLISPAPPQLEVEDICQVLGRDILRSSLLEDIDLYLECDEDSVYGIPINESKEGSKKPSSEISCNDVTNKSRTESTSLTGRYKCPHCSRTFTRQNLVMDHRVRVHQDQNLFPCSICHYQGKSSRHLKRHFERSHKNKLLENDFKVILEKAIERQSLPNNTDTAAKPQPIAASRLSDIVNLAINNYDINQNISNGNSFDNGLIIEPKDGIIQEIAIPGTNCHIISEIVNSKSSYTEQSSTKPLHCKLCLYSCKTTKLLKKHNETQHNQEREVHCCDKCGCTFKQKRSLDIHMKVHSGIFDFPCDECIKTFASSDHLRLHRRTHITTRQFGCHLCGKTFRVRSELAQHDRTVHAPALIKCPEVGCERTFTRRHLAVSHYKVHTGAFRCLQSRCGKTFRDAHNLRVHLKTHHGQKE